MTTEAYVIRWKGREFGPLDRDELLKALRVRRISLAHEIRRGTEWVPLRDFLADTMENDALESERLRADLQHSESQRTVANAQLAAIERQIEHLKVDHMLSQWNVPLKRPAPRRELHYAGLWSRACAKFIDIIIMVAATAIVGASVGLLMFIFPAFFGMLGSSSVSARTRMGAFIICYAALAPLGYWLYAAAFESSARRATFGKAVFGLAVCRVDGGQISFWRATWRHFATYLSLIPLAGGLWMAALSPRRQTLHDRLAGTVVIVER